MGDDGTTFNVRVYRTEVYKGAEVTTYKVRWKVGARLWKEGFRNAAQADRFPQRLTDRCPERGGVQSRHRQADGLGAG
jgi:hypothetical protein